MSVKARKFCAAVGERPSVRSVGHSTAGRPQSVPRVVPPRQEHVPEVRTKAGRSDPSLLGRAQDLIRESFSLVEDPGFQALVDDDSKEILAGLLATDLDKRWTAVGALRAVLAIAERRRIPVPDARERAPKEVAVWVTSDWE